MENQIRNELKFLRFCKVILFFIYYLSYNWSYIIKINFNKNNTRSDQPLALLMVDLSVENPNLLEFNVSDFSLNKELNTGTKKTSAIPSGEFCVECAYALMLMGKHPITRQKIGSVLVLADPKIKKNNKMILNSICCSMFGRREIKCSFQILLGLFDE